MGSDRVQRHRRRRHRHTSRQPQLRRPDQHPIHIGDNRVPEGGDAVAPQHPQQRLLRRASARIHGGRPRLRPGSPLPLLRDGPGKPRCHVERRHRRHPLAKLRSRDDLASSPVRTMHLALRRADHVHRRARTARPGRLRPVVAPHRNHGGITVSGRGDEASRCRDEHDRSDDHVRDDRNITGLDDDANARTISNVASPRSAASCRTSRCRSSIHFQA